MVVLSSAGLLPVAAVVGPRLVAVPLLPLVGAVIAALAATGFVAVGGNFIGWFVGLALAGALSVIVSWMLVPDRRPWHGVTGRGALHEVRLRVIGIVGALAILGACVWCLRGLATPTVGFDARALWIMRAGWFLQSHHQLLVKMRVRELLLGQSAYPPLVSASSALAWLVTGDQSVRLGVVVIALLNTCALAVAAFALVESGRQAARRLGSGQDDDDWRGSSAGAQPSPSRNRMPIAPPVAGVAAAVLLVFVAFGITEPFMTNGYADPIWSLAAVGAVAYGLQMGISRVNQGVTLVLLLVAGMSKDEGIATAVALIVLVALRGLVAMSREERRRRWWRPPLLGLAEVVAVAAWPGVMRIIHARGESATSFSPRHEWPTRARTMYAGMAPYLHVMVLAALLSVVGGAVLSRVRCRSGAANDWWAWAGLASGLLAVSLAYVTGTADLHEWLVGTVDRVTEFPALAAWWIVAMWAVVASGAPAANRFRGNRRSTGTRSKAETEAEADPSGHRILSPAAVVVE
jgi:hypothetical protein